MDGNGKLDFDEFRALIFRSKMKKEGGGVGGSASVTESLSESSAVSRYVQLFLSLQSQCVSSQAGADSV